MARIRFPLVFDEDFFLDEKHIRPKSFRPGNSLVGIIRFAHDAEIVLHGEEFLKAKPENALPVSHQDAYYPF